MLMVLDRRELVVRLKDGVVQVFHEGELLQRAAVNLLDMLVVYGNPLVESSVWRALAQVGVPAVVMASRGTQATAFLGEGLATQLQLRRLQYQCAEDRQHALCMARWFLVRKLLSYRVPFSLLHPHLEEGQKSRFLENLEMRIQQLHQAQQLDSFLGIEGQMSRDWFQLLVSVLPVQWKFTGRSRQPPRDPFNALLSLGYTVALAEIRQVLLSEGLDPAFGFLHQPYPARDSLALDVLEIFRSGVDVFALGLLSELNPDEFYYREQEGCRLSKVARPVFYQDWAVFRSVWPRPLQAMTSVLETATLREQVRGQVSQMRKVMEWMHDGEV
ncbi:CRISPR-associated endonuclease Cas1 [Thiothrix eikelboomii]|uniref:CRISPR-associated endonuclease Cas1 n=1 Tax=Thiothrix eikelboomii TaxID=92487 RepID=UPI003BAE6271